MISQILIHTLAAHIWQTRYGRSNLTVDWWFHRFWFILWQVILGRPGVADLPPHRMMISQILIQTLTGHTWQTRCGRSTCSRKWPFHRFWFRLWQLILGRPDVADVPPENGNFTYFDSYSDSSYLADQVWQISPLQKMAISHSYSWQLILGRPDVADVPLENGHFTDFDSYSDSSYLADQVWQIYQPIEWWFHRFWFRLWQVILGRPGVADLYPLQKMAISQILIHTVTAHIWQTRCGRCTPRKWQFHRFWFILWQLIFGRLAVADLPP